ncbi:MAG: HD domain-containing protein [Clostridiaceae bacterium]|jgi:dGTPase|nr:HD domain-containing protein [Clostridiaceae bacterium]
MSDQTFLSNNCFLSDETGTRDATNIVNSCQQSDREDACANVTCNAVDLCQKGNLEDACEKHSALLDALPRVRKELIEDAKLSPYASRASQSRGRVLPEPECPVRTVYERDVGRILYSMPFRRLRHKTQVFFNPQNDHICTRMEHVLYVSYLAETIGSSLGLNTTLIRAIALGHDLGHPPFGHTGESVLNRLIREKCRECDIGFQHELHSLRVIDVLSEHRDGFGLNLTFEVRDGIASHCGEKWGERRLVPCRNKGTDDLMRSALEHIMPATLEGCVVRICDRIAYAGRDVEDASRSGLLTFSDLPRDIVTALGHNNQEITNTLVRDVIRESDGRDCIVMSDEAAEALRALIEISVQRIYKAPKAQRYGRQVSNVLEGLFEYYIDLATSGDRDDTNAAAKAFFNYQGRHPEKNAAPVTVVTDYIAGMTDSYANRMFAAIYSV